MRVIYFSRDYTPHDHRFLAALAGTDHEVSYLRLEDRGRLLESRPIPAGVQVIDWWGGNRPLGYVEWPRAAWEVRKVIKKVEPDLVHAGPIQSAALMTALAGHHPLLSMSWGSDLMKDARRGIGRWAASWTLARTDVFTCDCRPVLEQAIKLGAPENRSYVFPWGVDLGHFSPGSGKSIRANFGWLADEVVLLSTRSWEPLYGVRELAEAFVEVAADEPRLRLIMLGSGGLAGELRRVFEEGNVASQVVMPGQLRYQDLPDYYRAADIYLSASHSDGSSISLLEAMACGLPAIVSDIAGNREWVKHGENGYLFETGDAGDLAWMLRHGLAEAEAFKEMGRKSRQIAEDRADWGENFKILMQAYESARQVGG